jgi:hypothetical protein
MGSAWHEIIDVRRSAGRLVGLASAVLVLGCGGERDAAPAAGTGSVATADTAAPSAAAPAPDTAAGTGTAADTGMASATDTGAATDTAASAPRPTPAPAKPAAPTKPAAAPAPKPKPAPQPQAPAATEPVDSPATAAPAQDTTPAATGQTETATAPLRDEYHQPPRDTVDQATYDGWKQYNLNCARCHGEDVLGSTIAPHLIMSLKPNGPINTQEAFTQVVCAGRPEKGMPSWCALGMEPQKINQMYAYVKGRSDGKIGPGRPALREGS